MNTNKKPAIYQTKTGEIILKDDAKNETLWASQKQISEIFAVTPQNITIHIKQIFADNELEEKATCKESLQVQKEGKREVKRNITEYNLDVIIAVGYRVNSVLATKFRQWATKTLKQHITEGWTINPKRISRNYDNFLQAVADLKSLAKNNIKNDDVLELVRSFANTWFCLEAFDGSALPKKGLTKRQVKLQASDLYVAMAKFKADLIAKNQATTLFAEEKQKASLEGIFGNVMQSVFGEEAYPSIEQKAAHLLYFIVKTTRLMTAINALVPSLLYGFYNNPLAIFTIPLPHKPLPH